MMRGLGALILILGLFELAFAVLSSGSAPGSTQLNLGLLVDRIVWALIGGASFVGGLLLIAGAALCERLDDLGRIAARSERRDG